METWTRRFPTMPHFEPLAQRLTEGEVILYGLGSLGRQVFPLLEERGLKVRAIFDSDPAWRGQSFQGTPVFQPEEYNGPYLPVVIASYIYYAEMAERLDVLGHKDYLPYLFLFFDREIDEDSYFDHVMGWEHLRKRLGHTRRTGVEEFRLRQVDLVVTEKCSLRCRDCSNLMQYFNSPDDTDFDQAMRSVARLFEAVDHISQLRLLGGEPLMNRDLGRYVQALQKYWERFDFIVIFTNGTILPSAGELERFQTGNVAFFVSDYGHKNQKLEAMTALLRRHGLPLRQTVMTRWQDCAGLRRYGRSEEQSREVLKQCCVQDIPSIKDGRLFRCPLAGNAAALGALPPDLNEYVDLDDPSIPAAELRGQIKELIGLEILKACDYCGGRPKGLADIPAAVQAGAPLSYTRYS